MGIFVGILIGLAVLVVGGSILVIAKNRKKYGPGGLSISGRGQGDEGPIMHGSGEDFVGIFYSEKDRREHSV